MCESYRLYLDTYVLKMGNMQGQRVGYIRVSTLDQQAGRQLVGVELDRTFTDHASGKGTKRPQLEQMLSFVRSGDTVIVHSMDRLARNLDDLRRIVQTLTQKGTVTTGGSRASPKGWQRHKQSTDCPRGRDQSTDP